MNFRMMHIPFSELLLVVLVPKPSVQPAKIPTMFFAPNPVRVIRGLVLQTWPRGWHNPDGSRGSRHGKRAVASESELWTREALQSPASVAAFVPSFTGSSREEHGFRELPVLQAGEMGPVAPHPQ